MLLATGATVNTLGPDGVRSIDIGEFIQDAYTTALQPGELMTEIVVPLQPERSGGAYIALKRCAPVYASASVAVQLTMHDDPDLPGRAHLSRRAWPDGTRVSNAAEKSSARPASHAASPSRKSARR